MTSTNANMHQKLVKNGLLKQKNLLPEEFIDHNDMLDSYGNESLERFKSQNLSIWGDLGLGAAVKPRQVLLSGDKKYLILVYKERHINIYNFITKHSAVGPNTSISPEDLKFEGVITCAAFCEVTRHLFVGSLNGEIVRIDLNSDNIKQSITPIKSSAKTSISSMDVSDDGQTLAYCHFGEVTTLDLFTFKEQHHRQNDRHYKSAYFVGTEQQNLLITKVRRAILDSGYEIRARTGAEKTPKKKVVGAQLMRPPEYAKLTQNKKHYLTLRNGTSNSGKPYTECQVFRIDNHDDPIRTFMLEHHVATDFEKLQFNITNDEIYLFCFSASENALYIHDFTNMKSTTECGKIPFKDYQYAAFADDDSCLVLVDGDGKVAVCDLFIDADRILSQHMLNFFEGKKDSLEISNGGEYVAYFQRNQDLEVLDLKRNKVILNLQITENYRELVSASIKFSDDKLKDEIIVEYKVVFEQDPENVREYLIQEKLPPQGSDPVYLSINLEERKPKHIEHIEHEAENGREETDQFVSPHLKFENAHSIRDLGDLPIPIIHLNHRSKPIETHLDQIDVWDNKSLTSIPLKPQQKEELKFAVKSSNEKYLFIANKDSTVDVYTFPVLQYICSWKNSRERNLVSIKVQKDDKFILLAYGDGHVEKRDFNFTPRSSLGNETKFYSFQRYLRLDKIPLIEGLQRPQNYHISSDQTILHLKALANTGDGFVDLVYRSDLKVPFLRDSYNKTPLHYILYHKKIDYGDLDALATYVLEYMSVLKEENEDEYQKVLESLNKLIPILVLDLEPGLATKYVKMVAPIEEVCMEKVGINLFAENRTVYFPGNDFDKVHKRALDTLVDGQEKMLFKKLDLKIDYTPHSKDILKYAIALAELKVEDLFKVPAIAHLVDYIWISTKGWTFLLFIWFSVLMILLSLCVAIGERTYGLEITILVFTSIGMAIEVMQFAVLRLRYWKSLWNNMDLICLVLIYIYIIFKLTDFEDQLTENWIAAFMIFLGYLRWAAYLRLFERTRQLIEVIVAITKDMGSFLIIMLLITFGFSIIFLKFLREDQDYYLWHLYYSYQLWYGNTDGIPSNSPFVLILECAIMFIMPVVLLNLLVTLMGESRETVRENAILTDSRTRLAMSIEAISLKRAIYYILVPSSRTQMKTERKEKRKKQKSHNPNKTSLFVCVPKSKDKECEEMNKRENEIANLQAQVKSILETLEASKESAKKDRENIELKAVEMIQALKDSQEDQAQKFRKLEEQARKNLLILQEQARKSERLEAQNKDNENKYKEPDHQEFEAIKQLMRDMKTELRLHIVGETDQIKYHMKEYMDKIDKALTKTEAEPTTKNEFANGAEEEDYERND